MGEVKGGDELVVRVACRGARSRGDRRSEIEVDPKRRGLRHGFIGIRTLIREGERDISFLGFPNKKD